MTKYNLSRRYRTGILGAAGVILLCVLLLALLFLPPAPTNTGETTSHTEPTEPTVSEYTPAPNLYGPDDFAYNGNYMACLAGEYSLGIDVSQFQGEIDWQQVKDAGITFVFIRVGGRYGSGNADLYSDDLYQQHYAGAKAAGLKVGAYFFSQAITVQEAREEANFALELMAGWELDLPVAYDWEHINETTRTAGMTSDILTACVLEFCQIMEDSGMEAMLYTNAYYSDVGLDLEKLQNIPIWLAMYSDEMTYPYRITAWQYTDKGVVPGISTYVDIDLYLQPLPA